MGTPYKMKGHTLPGIKQKESPAKLLGIAALTTAALVKAAIGGAVSAGIGKGVGAISKAKAKKEAAKNKANEAAIRSTEGMGGIGTKTKLTD
tara:strand:+ start:246 stop:521 length:276 start_codon:yes stop_codon:yes gene_type:complete